VTADQLKQRNEAIRAAWDDPLRRALMSKAKTKEGSRSASVEAYNAYFREYRRRKRESA
jgi:hypothetical protein